jgi:hypothetical protein
MSPLALRTFGNEKGFALVASILLSAILVMAAMMALWTSNTEVTVARNERDLQREFYQAEGGAVDALENYATGPTRWLTDAFLLSGPAAAGASVTSYSKDGQAVARVEVRCIEDTGALIAGLSDAANRLPQLRHIGLPPADSGFSMKYFEVRRYAVTATSTTGNTLVQVGAWKVFNKY